MTKLIKVAHIFTVMDISTAHITEQDNNKLLENPNSCSPLVHPFEGGNLEYLVDGKLIGVVENVDNDCEYSEYEVE